MAAKTMYSCDWCEVASPLPGFIGDGWEVVDHRGSKIHLCGTCAGERWRGISAARALRLPKSSQSSSKAGG